MKNLIFVLIALVILYAVYYYYKAPEAFQFFGGEKQKLPNSKEKEPKEPDTPSPKEPDTPNPKEPDTPTAKAYSMDLKKFTAEVKKVLKKYAIISTWDKTQWLANAISEGYLAHKYQDTILAALAQEGYRIKNIVLNDSTGTGYKIKPTSFAFDNIQGFWHNGGWGYPATEVQVKEHFASKGYDIWGVNYTKN